MTMIMIMMGKSIAVGGRVGHSRVAYIMLNNNIIITVVSGVSTFQG
jgi:hypothetical protein